MPSNTVFTIAPGVPFLKSFVAALLDGCIVESFSRALPPLAMADATIYVPTRRAARALALEFAAALERPATLLPHILPLGALDATENALFFDEARIEMPLAEDLPPAASEFWRRMHLAHLIFHWAQNLRHAIVSIEPDGTKIYDPREACLVGSSLLDAFALAGDLADLIDELIIEDIDFAALDPLVLPEFDCYWRITLDFLNIAIAHWPQILASNGLIDAARRRVLTIESQIRRIETGLMGGPVIAVGSTGTNRATARLLGAIARTPNGAVVLPGLDKSLDDGAWESIGKDGRERGDPAWGHPQAALRRLLRTLKITREDVTELARPAASLARRTRLTSEALRPAESTERWGHYRCVASQEIESALEGVALIEAADEREEALAIAVAMRQILEQPGKTVALVTPDRALARRVGAELTRFGLEVEDSAGEPLSASSYGTLARLVARCAVQTPASDDVIALLHHPLTHLGFLRIEVDRLAPLFEIGLLRQDRALTSFASPQEAVAAARRNACDRFAHPAQKRISDLDWAKLGDLAARLMDALAPLRALDNRHDLACWIAAHRLAIGQATQGMEGGPRGEDWEALNTLFDEVAHCTPPDLPFDAESYLLFFAQITAAMALRGRKRTHPRLKIFGLLEARLMEADLMLLGSLDETIWPPETRSDAFLNRPMRAALGLCPPERKIGQTAHDFVMAMGAERVILTRALKREGAPSVASRFVQRLAAVSGNAFESCRLRGQYYLGLARALDHCHAPASAGQRPMPRPALHLRPTHLSVTRIETLRRDPYAIYAEFILGLTVLPPAAGPMSSRLMGTAIHVVLAEFGRRYPTGPLPERAAADLLNMLQAAIAEDLEDPEFSVFVWPRVEGAALFYLDFEAQRRSELAEILVEIEGRLSIPLADGSLFTLSAIADRLERRRDGKINLIDYKTGTPPGVNEVRVGFAPQLTLEAAMARRGAFGPGIGTDVAEAVYVKLGGKEGGQKLPLHFKKQNKVLEVGEVAETHFEALLGLLNQFRDERTAYPPRPFPKFAAKYNVYDHLARVREWAQGFDEEEMA